MPEIPGIGVLQDGVVERDPLDDRYRLRIVGPNGEQKVLDVQDLLVPYDGQAVRVTVASQEGLRAAEQILNRTTGSEGN